MQQITTIKELKTAINKNGEMVIAKNSKNDVVIMSMEEYKNNIFDKKTVEKLLKSEDDINNGRTKKATKVVKELREKYGF